MFAGFFKKELPLGFSFLLSSINVLRIKSILNWEKQILILLF